MLVMTLLCDQITVVSTILSAPVELTVDAKESCESGNKSDLDQIHLKIIMPMFNHFDMTSNLVLILRPMTYCMFAYLSM